MKALHVCLTMMACVVAVGCSEGGPTAPSPASLADFGDQNRAAPDPKGRITIVQGSIVLDFGLPGEPGPRFPERSLFLRGTRGFKLEATPLSTGRDPAGLCRASDECTPGTPVSLDAVWAGGDLPVRTATLQGQTFTHGGGDDPDAYVDLSGTAILPPQAEEATITAPFELQEGHFSWRDGGEQFQGRGTATVFLRWSEALDSWWVSRVRYDFRGQSGR